jgi:hypothetical protein
MNVPKGEHAIVEYEKVRDYLLNEAHPDGYGKAEFFTALGFRRESWEALVDALRRVVRDSPITKSMTSRHGYKYIVDGLIQAPGGRAAMVRTVWIVDTGGDVPRLVTAYPKEQEP